MSKLMILGKLRSQPKKLLHKAKTIDEITELLSESSSTDIAELYGLSLSNRDNIIDAVFRSLTNKNFLNFSRGLNDSEYDPNRYAEWSKFREKNTFVCNSDEYFKVKYGNTWEKHAQDYRLRKPNMYDIKYWMSKGMNNIDAVKKIEEIKYKTSLSLERCIELYGEEDGPSKHKFIHRFHKNYKEYWGKDTIGFVKYKRETNRCTREFWIKRGYSEEEIKTMISNSQKMYSGLHREYWESMGYNKNDVDLIMNEIDSKKDGTSLEHCIKKHGDKGYLIYESRRQQKSSCFREYGKFAEELYEGFSGYSIIVDRYTKKSLKYISECPGVRGSRRGQYQLDHKFSKIQGFLEGVPPDIIGHPMNLEWILTEENCSKRGRCSITLDELMEKVNENKKN